MDIGKQGYHDIGGEPGGPIDRATKPAPRWAQVVDALRDRTRVVSLHEQRRKIEEMGADLYARLGYYEIRTLAVARLLVEKGMLTEDELNARIAAIRARAAQGQGRDR